MHVEAESPVMRREASVEDRRRFLKSCGRFAVITPPTITLLLASGAQNFAVAGSGMGGGSLGGGTTYYVPRDDSLIAAAGGAKPGDTICFNTPTGTNCKPVTPH